MKKILLKTLISIFSIIFMAFFIVSSIKAIITCIDGIEFWKSINSSQETISEAYKAYIFDIIKNVFMIIVSVFLFLVVNIKDLKFITQSLILQIKEYKKNAPERLQAKKAKEKARLEKRLEELNNE